MRNYIRIIAAFCALLTLASCSSTQASTEIVGQNTDYVRFQALDGTWHVLDEYKGKTTVLVFWAAWCSKSRSTLQKLNALAKRGGSSSDRVFIAISVDKQEDEEKFRSFIRGVPIDAFLHSYSGNAEYDEAYVRMRGEELPHVVIIDSSGTVKAVGHSEKFVYEFFGELPD